MWYDNDLASAFLLHFRFTGDTVRKENILRSMILDLNFGILILENIDSTISSKICVIEE